MTGERLVQMLSHCRKPLLIALEDVDCLNRPEVLDAALTRAGHVDRKFFIDYARDEEVRIFHSRVAQYFAVQPWPEVREGLPKHATIADAQALAFQKT